MAIRRGINSESVDLIYWTSSLTRTNELGAQLHLGAVRVPYRALNTQAGGGT